VQVAYKSEDTSFVDKVLAKCRDAENTTLYVLDGLDGSALAVAKLLANSGFEKAYAITGGVEEWQVAQILSVSVLHVFFRSFEEVIWGLCFAQFYLCFEQHMQYSLLIVVTQDLAPSEFYYFHNMINRICWEFAQILTVSVLPFSDC